MFDQTLLSKLKGRPTPFFYYDLALLETTLGTAQAEAGRYGYHIHYALKANANLPILAKVQKAGLGADCVSIGEVNRALAAGFAPGQIVFAGVGKTDRELVAALQAEIFCFNVESVQELQVLDQLAAQVGKTATVALRINPNVEVNTHKYITTGSAENKFGIPPRDFAALVALLPSLTHVRVRGLHSHIGSQIRDMDNFKQTCLKFNEMRQWFEQQGLSFAYLNLGGGLGVDYHQPDDQPVADFAHYFATMHQYLQVVPGQEVHFELGRSLVAQCGSLVTQVLYTKQGEAKNFAVVDAAMTELIRPALYQAYHRIENLSHPGAATTQYDVVGPVCESSDFLGKDVPMPLTERGHWLVVRTAGAYGQVMASNYNLRDLAEAVYSDQV